jgi:hypothetical protein
MKLIIRSAVFLPRAGDILLTREAPVGFACIMPAGIKACLTQRLMLLRPHTVVIEPSGSRMPQTFLYHFLLYAHSD